MTTDEFIRTPIANRNTKPSALKEDAL